LDLANFQQSPARAAAGAAPVGGRRVDVIYCRFSSELQRTDSIKDQARRCRDGLERMGIPHGHFTVIADEAVSGTRQSRPGFDRVKKLMYAERLGMLVVTEQSRLTRGDNAKALIKDVIFHGGRFVSIAEGVDTDKKGWQLSVGVSELHHSQTNEDTAERVRGGQEGRVLDGDGSAGDFPYGYRSEYVDPAGAIRYYERGAKPPRRVVIDEAAAAVVRQIFELFVAGQSIGSIVRWWEANREKFPPITKSHIHHQHVRRILANRKYIGEWTYGTTTTVKNSGGRKKQVKARVHQRVTRVQRPGLRIISQDLWDRAQAQLARLAAVYGQRADGKRRGPAEHYRHLYAKTLLNGQVKCGHCGTALTVMGSGTSRYSKGLGCKKHKTGACPMATRVPYELAEQRVLALIEPVLLAWPQWMRRAADEARRAIGEMARDVPDQGKRIAEARDRVERDIGNLVDALASGVRSEAISRRLESLEKAKANLQAEADGLKDVAGAQRRMPDDKWLAAELRRVVNTMRLNLPAAARPLRAIVGDIVADEVIPRGRKRGYARLRFRLEGWAAIKTLLVDQLPEEVLAQLKPADAGAGADGGEQFVLDLGGPTRMDELAPRIAQMRDAGSTWAAIVARFHEHKLTLGNAWAAYMRWKEAERRQDAA
jgi:hypothetical protein